MPTYEITAPDGKVLEITAPDGATQEQVLAYAQQQYKPGKADFSGVRGGSSSTEARAERDAAGQLTDYGRKVQETQADARKRYGPTEGGLDNYLAGMGKSFVDTYTGVKQLATDAASRSGVLGTLALRNAGLDGAAGAFAENVASPLLRSSQAQAAEVAERKKLDSPLMDTWAGIGGNVTGTLAQLLGPGIAARGSVAGAMLLPATIRGNAVQGAVLGAAQPAENGGERALNTAIGFGAGFGGAALPKVVGAAYRPVRNAVEALLGRPTASGVERKAGELIAQEAGDMSRLLRPSPSSVPGVQRTLAEESLDPGVARLERQMRGQSSQFVPMDRANAAARVAAVERIAGTDADMAAAVAARDAGASSSRSASMAAAPAQVASTLKELDDAIAKTRGRTAVQPALQALRDRLASYADQSGGVDVRTLDNVRMDIGDMLSGKFGGESGAALAGSRELIGVRDALNSEVSGQIPAFGAYLDAYRTGSIPINRMEVGRELLDRGAGSAIPDPETGIRALTPAAFGRQVNDLDSLAARATGFGKARADQILTPQDIATLRAVQDDLSRQNFRATAGSGGNSMTQERQALAQRMGRDLAKSLPMGIGRFVDVLEASGERRLNETLTRLLANPAEARRVLQSLNQQDRAVVSRALAQLSATSGASAPALAE